MFTSQFAHFFSLILISGKVSYSDSLCYYFLHLFSIYPYLNRAQGVGCNDTRTMKCVITHRNILERNHTHTRRPCKPRIPTNVHIQIVYQVSHLLIMRSSKLYIHDGTCINLHCLLASIYCYGLHFFNSLTSIPMSAYEL